MSEQKSVSELLAEKRRIEEQLEAATERELKQLRDQIEDQILKSPFSFQEVFPEMNKGKGQPAATAKRAKKGVVYYNPDNPEEVWRGGRKPNWIVDKEQNEPGFKIENLPQK